ncbi:hypothetical protein [Streptomyces caniscabiei]|uniref:hypothetical protein n=1 Tax=Streptomyces caniscabiei TaxID=2746961 RepID=UPI0038F5DE91
MLEAWPGARYDPDADSVAVAAAGQERRRERAAADAQAAEQRAERELRDWALRRAEHLLELAQAGRLDASVPVEPDVWPILRHRSEDGVQQIDAWMVKALANRSGALADPGVVAAARQALPQRVTAHAALLEALDTVGEGAGDVSFADEIAQSAPEATEHSPAGSP